MNVMSPFKRSLPPGTGILMPEAPERDPIGGFSWWQVEQHADYSAGIATVADSLSEFIDQAIARYELTPSYVLALGFSQGGALLSVLMQRQPERFRKVGLLASFVVKQPNVTFQTAVRPQVFIAHGTEDQIVSIAKARKGAEYLESLNFNVRMVEDPVGHKVGSLGMQALKEWLQTE